MKTLLLALSLLSPAAFAAPSADLLEVTRTSGFVMPDYGFSSKCEVNATHTLLRHSFRKAGRKEEVTYEATKYTAALPSAEAVTAAIQEAARSRIEKVQGPVDGPTNIFTGILEGEVVDQHVKLYQASTSGDDYRNVAPSVDALVEFGNLNCPYPKLGR